MSLVTSGSQQAEDIFRGSRCVRFKALAVVHTYKTVKYNTGGSGQNVQTRLQVVKFSNVFFNKT
jgi:hypothetical protein